MTLLIEHTNTPSVTIEIQTKTETLPTIKRSDLIWAAEEALRAVSHVPPALAEYVMEVAETADYISPWWAAEGKKCGCLIGTARMNQGYAATPSLGGPMPGSNYLAEQKIGMRFAGALANLGHRQHICLQDGCRMADIYAVTDG